MKTSCQKLKTEYEELKELKDEFVLEYNKAKDGDNLTRAKELKARLEKAVKELMEKLFVQIEDAIELLGEKEVIGPEDLKNTWDVKLSPEEIPRIPFSFEDLERAKELGQYLILRAEKTQDGTPLTMLAMNDLKKEEFKKAGGGKILYSRDDEWKMKSDFYTKETPELSWALTSKDVISDSTDKNYLEQTEEIISYIKNEVFKNAPMIPHEYAEAIAEFKEKKDEIQKLMESDRKKATEELENLKITALTRQTPADVLFDGISYFLKNKEKLLEYSYTCTSRLTYDGMIVNVGCANAGGANVDGRWPDSSIPLLGVSFSRRL